MPHPFVELQQTSNDSSKFFLITLERVFFTGIEQEFYARGKFL